MPGHGSGPGSVGAGFGGARRVQRPCRRRSEVLVRRRLSGGGGVVFTGSGRQREEVCSEGRPRRLAGEFGDDLVGLAVEHLNDLGSDELLGCDMEPVGVALDGVEQPAAGLLSWRSRLVAEAGASSRARICCRVSVGVRGAMVSGRMTVWSPSPTTCR